MNIPTYKEEPFEWYKKMRKENPVYKEGNVIYLFKNRDIISVLSDYKTYSSQFRSLLGVETAQELDNMASPSILISDPPAHTDLRNLVSSAFSPNAIMSYENKIREITVSLISNLGNKKSFDLVSSLSSPLPINVIADILGIPMKDTGLFKKWSDRLATSLGRGPDMQTQMEMSGYFGRMIDNNYSDNLIKKLTDVIIDNKKLTKPEIASFAILLLVAGNETTANLLTNTMLILSKRPEIYERIKNDNKFIDSVIEEALRYTSPVQSTRRYAKKDTHISGIGVNKNDFIQLYLGSANRDEDLYENPEEFNPDRKNKRHIAFGNGIHFCLGAPLARLESRIFLKEFSGAIDRFSVIDPAPDDKIDSDIMYGYNKLIIKI